VAGRQSRSEMIGVFLALLELIRQKKILVAQGEEYNELDIEPAPEEHRKTYEHASLNLADDVDVADAEQVSTEDSSDVPLEEDEEEAGSL
jgi:segregation and condensation protein A